MVVREIHGIEEVETILQGRFLEATQQLRRKSLTAPLGSHHDRNFGAVLAIWDWMGGSLCLAERGRARSFGVGDGTAPRPPRPSQEVRAR